MKHPGMINKVYNISDEIFNWSEENFKKAAVIIKKYPDSIKGPDNMLKLALSFSNLERKDDACNVLYIFVSVFKWSN